MEKIEKSIQSEVVLQILPTCPALSPVHILITPLQQKAGLIRAQEKHTEAEASIPSILFILQPKPIFLQEFFCLASMIGIILCEKYFQKK